MFLMNITQIIRMDFNVYFYPMNAFSNSNFLPDSSVFEG